MEVLLTRAGGDSALFFAAVVMGFIFGLYYEVFRFLRLAGLSSPGLVFVQDLLFFLPVTLLFLFLHYALSDGVIRYFSVAGVTVGFLLYFASLGKILLFFSETILRAIRFFLHRVWLILLRPIWIVFKNITNYLYAKSKFCVIIVRKKKSARDLARQKKRIIKRAGKGFSK